MVFAHLRSLDHRLISAVPPYVFSAKGARSYQPGASPQDFDGIPALTRDSTPVIPKRATSLCHSNS